MLPALRKCFFAARNVVVLAVVFTLVAVGSSNAQFTLTETGFVVTDLGGSVGAKQIECSPGGIWGDYVYVADSAGDLVERISYTGFATVFANMPVSSFPVGLAFGPGPGSNFGDYLYVSNYSNSTIVRVDQYGTVTPFTAAVPNPVSGTFDPTGAYSNDMYVAQGYTGPIYRVDEFGVATSWSAVQGLYLKFGPGTGLWGTGLYGTSQTAVGIVKIDNAGVPTNFSTGFTNPEGFDWAYGTGFGGDMFATDVVDMKLWRIQDDGTKTLWATGIDFADVAFCNGSLYVVGYHGECLKIDPELVVPAVFRGVEATATDGAIELNWNVIADETIAGFDVYRGEGVTEDVQSILSTGSLGFSTREYRDSNVRPGVTYTYVIAAVTPDGREFRSAPATATTPRVEFSARNYPNPFNPATTIEYTLPYASQVTVNIYDAQGLLVATLENSFRSAGTHTIEWNGTDGSGSAMASGAYFYRLAAGSKSITRKLVLLK